MSARRVQSDEALRIGLANRRYPPEQLREQTYAYARDLREGVASFMAATVYGEIELAAKALAEARLRPSGYAGHASPSATWLRHA